MRHFKLDVLPAGCCRKYDRCCDVRVGVRARKTTPNHASSKRVPKATANRVSVATIQEHAPRRDDVNIIAPPLIPISKTIPFAAARRRTAFRSKWF